MRLLTPASMLLQLSVKPTRCGPCFQIVAVSYCSRGR